MKIKQFFMELGLAILVGIGISVILAIVSIPVALIGSNDVISQARQLLLIVGALVLLVAAVGLMFRRPSAKSKFPEWEKRFSCFSISYFMMVVGFAVIGIGCIADYLMRI